MSTHTIKKSSLKSGSQSNDLRDKLKFKISVQQERSFSSYGMQRIPNSVVSTPYTSLAGYKGSETDISKANTKPNSLDSSLNSSAHGLLEEPKESFTELKSILKERHIKYPTAGPKSTNKTIGPKTKTVCVIVPRKSTCRENQRGIPPSKHLSFEDQRRLFYTAEFTIARFGRKMSEVFMAKSIQPLWLTETHEDKIATEMKRFIKKGLMKPAYDSAGASFELTKRLVTMLKASATRLPKSPSHSNHAMYNE